MTDPLSCAHHFRKRLVFSADGLALICGFASTIPFVGLRGALFCLFPGFYCRSSRGLIAGFLLGFATDHMWSILTTIAGISMDTRALAYLGAMIGWLPIPVDLRNPGGHGLDYVIGVATWCMMMYMVWAFLLRRVLIEGRARIAIAISTVASAFLSYVVWVCAHLIQSHDPNEGLVSRSVILMSIFIALLAIPMVNYAFCLMLLPKDIAAPVPAVDAKGIITEESEPRVHPP